MWVCVMLAHPPPMPMTAPSNIWWSMLEVALSTTPTASVAAPTRPETAEMSMMEWRESARQPREVHAARSAISSETAEAMHSEAAASTCWSRTALPRELADVLRERAVAHIRDATISF